MNNFQIFFAKKKKNTEEEEEEDALSLYLFVLFSLSVVDFERERRMSRHSSSSFSPFVAGAAGRKSSGEDIATTSKIVGQIDIEIERAFSPPLSIRLTNKNYDRCAEMCVNFCESRGLPMKIAPALALRLRAAYKKALMQQTMDTSASVEGGDDAGVGVEEEKEEEEEEEEEVRAREKMPSSSGAKSKSTRTAATTKKSENSSALLADDEIDGKMQSVVVKLPSDPADMARRIAEIKKNTFSEGETRTTIASAFKMVTPSNVGSWNPVASGEVTMQKVGADVTKVVRRERKEEEEKEEMNRDLVEVVVVEEPEEEEEKEETRKRQQDHENTPEEEEEEEEEEMLEFEITPTKQDYAESFARPSDWFIQDIEDEAKKTKSTHKTSSKKEAADDSDTSLSEKIIHASPGFKDSLKMFEAMDVSPKKKSSFVKSPTMTAPGFVSPMEMKPKRYSPRDLNE
jgi:hypothetical protein